MDFSERMRGMEGELSQWFQWLHRHPELGLQEYETADYIEARLSELEGIKVTRPCRTGVMGVLKGPFPGRTVAFRADIDGLPVKELAEVPYRSEHDGVMHACGHDGHAAMLLGAAKALWEMRKKMRGEIRFLFQPAEEIQPGGAVQMIEGGAIDGVEAIFGAHLDVLHQVNTFGVLSGPLMASSSSFKIEITGTGGHAAFPEQTVDTVYAAARVIEALQGTATRRIHAADRMVITVTQMEGGIASNIIPERVTLGGTLRILDEACETELKRHLKETVEGCCAVWGAEGTIRFEEGQKSLINSRELEEQVKRAILVCPGASVYEDTPVLGGEDFSAYLQYIPGFYYKVGAKPDCGTVHPHHHSRFVINQKALEKGAAACAALLWDAAGNQ